jgi:5'-methylthioadenosine phosphorylase
MTDVTIGIIGGSGLYALDGMDDAEQVSLETPFGSPSDSYLVGTMAGSRVAFLPRHRRDHSLSPSEIPARANIYGFKQLGVRYLIAVNAVRSLREEYAPGHVVIPHQLFDHTRGMRPASFFERGVVAHAAFDQPFCHQLTEWLTCAAQGAGPIVHTGGPLVVVEGPQFPTRGESEAYRGQGHALVGQTTMPEARLAREAELAYATLALVAGYDSWHPRATSAEALQQIRENAALAQKILRAAVPLIDPGADSPAHHALEGAIITDLGNLPAAARKRFWLLLERYLPQQEPEQEPAQPGAAASPSPAAASPAPSIARPPAMKMPSADPAASFLRYPSNQIFYLIAFTLRSGSNLLCDYLNANRIGSPSEYFQYPFGEANGYWYGLLDVAPNDTPGYLQQLVAQQSVNNVFGAKITWDHKNALLDELAHCSETVRTLHDLFPGHRMLHLSRKDKGAQAVSLWRAGKTQQWSSQERAANKLPDYDFFGILTQFYSLLVEEYFWQQYFETSPEPPLRLVYEDFLADPHQTMRAVVDYIYGDAQQKPRDIVLSNTLRMQRDHVSEAFRARFIEDMEHIGAPSHWKGREVPLDRWIRFFQREGWNYRPA